MWKDAARYIHNATDGAIDVSANSLYFMTNNYVDGISRIAESMYGLTDLAQGRKDFSLKTDLPLFGSFFGTRSSVDAREFTRVAKKIEHMEKTINSYKTDPARYAEYIAKYPMEEAAVDTYNKMRNQQLNPLYAEDKGIRLNREFSPMVRKQLLQINKYQEDLIKRQMIDIFKAYDIKP
jgi:hypothetical protein